MTTRQQVAADQNSAMRLVFKPSRLAMFLSEVQSQPPLDSRLEHAGMTDFVYGIDSTRQGAGNRPTDIASEHLRKVVSKRS